MSILRVVAVFALSVSAFGATLAQDSAIRQELFGTVDVAMATANEAQASVLAPVSFNEAAELYRRAELNLSRGRGIQDIREDLAEATRLLNRATERAGVARVSIAAAIEARGDALAAEAPVYSQELWEDAEESFSDAVRRLEGGNLNRARSAAGDAETEFRAAELDAIEVNYFAATRDLIAQADRNRVDRVAPKTLARAQSLLAQAENALRQNRYDTDLPRSLAREARYEAQHSIYLAERIRSVDDRNITVEDLLIQAEVPLTRIGGELDQVVEFDQGFEVPTAALVERIGELRAAEQTLSEREEQLAFLEGELTLLEGQLGEESERRRLQEQIQQRFEQLASVFTREEGTVLRSGNDVIVRLGLNFDSGSAVIQPRYFALLRKIQTAIDLFPDSQVEIQGHTDSFGDDASNLTLSTNRADSVLQYLAANMSLGRTAMESVGFGESAPLANNETPEGRQRNRRIDLLIRPNMEQLRAALTAR